MRNVSCEALDLAHGLAVPPRVAFTVLAVSREDEGEPEIRGRFVCAMLSNAQPDT